MSSKLQDLFCSQIKCALNMENQINAAMPHLIALATEKKLKEGIQKHLKETQEQSTRLETILEKLNDSKKLDKAVECKDAQDQTIKALIEDAKQASVIASSSAVKDCAIIGALQNIEHYEIAIYGTLIAFAKQLEIKKLEDLLNKSLDEEYHADKVLNKIAEGGFFSKGLNKEAMETTRSTLRQLLITILQKLHDSKTQSVSAIQTILQTTKSRDLQKYLTNSIEEIRAQIGTLKQVLGELNATAEGATCKVTTNILMQIKMNLSSSEPLELRDCALVADLQKLHHILIASFGTAASFAKHLELDSIAKKLAAITSQEQALDKKLTRLAEGGLFSTGLNTAALQMVS